LLQCSLTDNLSFSLGLEKERSRSKEKKIQKKAAFEFYTPNKNLNELISPLKDDNKLPNVSDIDSNLSNAEESPKFIEYLEDLIEKLSKIRSRKNKDFSKEITYSKLLRLVHNCEKMDLDFELLIGSNLGKYLHTAYAILLEINDNESIGYTRLLPRLSKLRKTCKKKILSFVINKSNPSFLQIGQGT